VKTLEFQHLADIPVSRRLMTSENGYYWEMFIPRAPKSQGAQPIHLPRVLLIQFRSRLIVNSYCSCIYSCDKLYQRSIYWNI